jgi:hypothetical protein
MSADTVRNLARLIEQARGVAAGKAELEAGLRRDRALTRFSELERLRRVCRRRMELLGGARRPTAGSD